MNQRLAAAVLVEALEQAGVRAAFGVTGGAIGTIFDRLSASSVELYHCQHEGAAAYAAMGRAIAARGAELPLCFGTAGPGSTNLLTGVAAAYAEGVPLFVLTGNTSTESLGIGALQDGHESGIDAVRMFDSVTVANRKVTNAEELADTCLHLARLAISHRRPVHLNVPINVSNQMISAGLLPTSLQTPPSLSAKDVSAMRRWLTAKRPLVLAGNGVRLSAQGARLEQLATQQGIPVVVTSHGRGSVSEDHPCFYGAFGFASNGNARMFLENYQPDAILFLGTGLGEMATSGWSGILAEPAFKLHVDIDAAKFDRSYKVQATIHNDIGSFLDAALAEPQAQRHLPSTLRVSSICRRRRTSDKSPVHPEDLLYRLSRELPDDAVVFAEPGNSMAWAFRHLELSGRQELYVPLGLASMGSGLGAALGAATYWRDRTVVCLAGDCATLMQGTELKTAVEYGVRLILLVMNDGGHGMVHHGSRLIGLKDTHVRFNNPVRFAQFAGALGAGAITVSDSGQWEALHMEDLLRTKGPLLIDVHIDETAVPPIADRAKVVGESQPAPAQLSNSQERAAS